MNRLTFELTTSDVGRLLVPVIDGVTLPKLVTDFEVAHVYNDPAGGYAGLSLDWLWPGPLDLYFRGLAGNRGYSDRDNEICVLDCDCGVTGCWSLTSSVRQIDRGYRWEGFRNPHRPGRDYSVFGPFDFERQQYEDQIGGLPKI